MTHGPLDGVKVLDLSEDIAGSFCARLLADYGADVLKLEPPVGAALRRMPPFFEDDPHPEKSLFFLAMNLNKKSATINLKTAAGWELFRELIPHVDVVVESYRPGYLADLGLGYEALEAINPGLVMTSITPFGQTGPYSQYAGEEIVSYAMGLIMSISGLQDREPLKHGGFQAQYEGGLNGAAAVASTMMATQSMYPFIGGTQPRRRPSGSNFGHPMACEDGWIIVQTGGGATWETIANFFRDPRLHEERFTDTAQRNRNGEELDRIVLESISERGKWDLFTEAATSRMLFGLVQTPSELAECPQLESRDFYREIEHPVIGKIKVPAMLFNMSLTPYQYVMPAPTLGQHNREIYVDGLGLTPRDLTVLRQTDAI